MSAPNMPVVIFATPRQLPHASSLAGRVAVLDIAFAADGMGTPFEETTGRFITELGSRLAAWVDHHDHEHHVRFAGDRRFTLATKAQHGACPEMVTPDVVKEAGPIDTLVCHSDLDGLYAAAKWILGGKEPYAGADDARAVDTRIGAPGPTGELIDKALRSHARDVGLKHRIVRHLVTGLRDREHADVIRQAATDFDAMASEARRLAERYEPRGRASLFVDAQRLARCPYDKTLLLLEGQKRARVAIVRDAGTITAAAAFDSGIDFVRLLGLGGGMPTRIPIAESRLDELLQKLEGLPVDPGRHG